MSSTGHIMRRIALRAVLGLGLGIVVFTAALAAYVGLNWDRSYESVPLPDLHASNEPAVVARGEYLVLGPAHVDDAREGDAHVRRGDEAAAGRPGADLGASR
jgi:hypothetical protein